MNNTGVALTSGNSLPLTVNATNINCNGITSNPGQPYWYVNAVSDSTALTSGVIYTLKGTTGSAPSNIMGTPTTNHGFTYVNSTGVLTVISAGLYYMFGIVSIQGYTASTGNAVAYIENSVSAFRYCNQTATASSFSVAHLYCNFSCFVYLNASTTLICQTQETSNNTATIYGTATVWGVYRLS